MCRQSPLRALTTEQLLGLLVQVGDGNPSSQHSVIRVAGGHGGCCLSCQVVQLYSFHTAVNAIDYFEGDGSLWQGGRACSGGRSGKGILSYRYIL